MLLCCACAFMCVFVRGCMHTQHALPVLQMASDAHRQQFFFVGFVLLRYYSYQLNKCFVPYLYMFLHKYQIVLSHQGFGVVPSEVILRSSIAIGLYLPRMTNYYCCTCIIQGHQIPCGDRIESINQSQHTRTAVDKILL